MGKYIADCLEITNGYCLFMKIKTIRHSDRQERVIFQHFFPTIFLYWLQIFQLKATSKLKGKTPPPPRGKESRDWISFLYQYRYMAVFILTFALYSNTISNDYNMDDKMLIGENLLTSKGISTDNLQKIFTQPYYQDNMGYSYGYRPMTTLSFTIERSILGDNPHISHFINLFLYSILCMVLLYALELMLVNFNPWLPILAILIFTCHPLHTEVVASIKNRDEILSFLCAAIIFSIIFLPGRPFWLRFILSFIFFISW